MQPAKGVVRELHRDDHLLGSSETTVHVWCDGLVILVSADAYNRGRFQHMYEWYVAVASKVIGLQLRFTSNIAFFKPKSASIT